MNGKAGVNGENSGKVLVFGSLNADLTISCERLPQPGETLHGRDFTVLPGGKSANQAVAAARLGAEVAMIGAVGNDSNGKLLLGSVSSAGVDVSRVATRPSEPTGVAVISVDAHGENTIIISPGANGTLSTGAVAENAAAFDGAAVLCLCLEVDVAAVTAAATAAHSAGATVILNLSPFGEVPPELLAVTDILLVNAHEGASLLDAQLPESTDAADWRPALDSFAKLGLKRVVVTLGADGAMVLDSTADEAAVAVPSRRVKAVDTTGAGDGFFGALASQVAAGASLVDAARFAAVVGALASTKRGAQSSYPTLADVQG